MVEPADFHASESDDEKIRGKTDERARDARTRVASDPAGVAANE